MSQRYFFTLLIVYTLIGFQAFADEYWVENSKDSREFITLKDEDNIIEFRKYTQSKGDYQDLVEAKKFNTLDEARAFIDKKFKDYRKVQGLEFWPVQQVLDEKANSQIWPTIRDWSPLWEDAYAAWLGREITSDFFIRHNIPVDCADAGIGMRWIFSRIYGLPVANTLADTNTIFGNFSMRSAWAKYPTSQNWYTDKLFLTALNYIMDLTSTRTILKYDGLPVRVSREGLNAGSFIIQYINNSGHLRTITENNFDNPNELPVYLKSATSPREIRALFREPLVDQAWPIQGIREIMAFRWPIKKDGRWTLMPRTSDYRYSLESYDRNLQNRYSTFMQFVLERTNPSFNPSGLIITGITDVKSYLNVRIAIVRDGYNYCRSHGCPLNSRSYDDWSTPSRDRNMKGKFIEMENLMGMFVEMNPDILEQWADELQNTWVNIEGRDINLKMIRRLFVNGLVSSNPNDSIEKRWGFNNL